uniref:Uncharacterized protein n=1 Tax=Anguilla anguilla TaxID=7936 RepID=A0A0E9SWF6_ANGAN
MHLPSPLFLILIVFFIFVNNPALFQRGKLGGRHIAILGLGEVFIDAPLHKVLPGHLQTPVVSLSAVDPDQLLCKFLRQ